MFQKIIVRVLAEEVSKNLAASAVKYVTRSVVSSSFKKAGSLNSGGLSTMFGGKSSKMSVEEAKRIIERETGRSGKTMSKLFSRAKALVTNTESTTVSDVSDKNERADITIRLYPDSVTLNMPGISDASDFSLDMDKENDKIMVSIINKPFSEAKSLSYDGKYIFTLGKGSVERLSNEAKLIAGVLRIPFKSESVKVTS